MALALNKHKTMVFEIHRAVSAGLLFAQESFCYTKSVSGGLGPGRS